MLRDFSRYPSLELIDNVLIQFDIPLPSEERITLIEFQILSPDSFRWRFLLNKIVYYLYAEDHIDSFKAVQDGVNSWFAADTKVTFIKAKQHNDFADTEPFKNATTYREPKDYDKMKYFAVSSGYDFVFLCKSNEDLSSIFFNN
jgi:hypothetical protein